VDIDFKTIFGQSRNPYVLLDPAFTIVEMNDAYLVVTMRRREDLVGRSLFDAFPSDPASPEHRQLKASLERVVREKQRDHLPLIRYDIPKPDGGIEERYWSATHTPLLGPDGAVRCILQHTVDVTELHRLRLLVGELPAGLGRVAAATDMYRRAAAVQEANTALQEEQARLRSLFS
jgi:PAS domain S-box-containing protein